MLLPVADHRTGRRTGRGRRLALRLIVPGLLIGSAGCTSSSIPEEGQPALTASASPVTSASPTPTPRSTSGAGPSVSITGTDPTAQRPEPGTRPGRLVINGVDIDLPVVPVGVEDGGTMELPSTVREVGWYEFGARPADRSGTTVLAGHVDTNREGLGPMARLAEVDDGALIIVTARNGDVSRYRVRSARKINKQRVPLDQVFAREGAPRLVVITCGGPFSRRTGYRDNLIVTAEPA